MSQLKLLEEIKTNGNYDYEAIQKASTLETNLNKEYVKEILKSLKDVFTKNKIQYIIGQFSGGHDEGGFDSVYLANKENDEIVIKEQKKEDFNFYVIKKKFYRFDNDKEKKISLFYTDNYDKNNLLNILEEILYSTGCLEEYGSFAGEFSVDGTVTLDVFTGKWNRDGQETVESYEANAEEGEL